MRRLGLPETSADRRPGWRLVPWALLLTLGGLFLFPGLWMLVTIVRVVHWAWPGGPAAMSPDERVEVGRVLLAYVALIASGLLCCVCAFRCRCGAWRSASYAALLAAVLLATYYVLLTASQVV
jgi:heme/copper-type cytochrome/quinol oxidase subunit 3